MHKYYIVVIDNHDNDNLILDICTYDNYQGFIEGKIQLENRYFVDYLTEVFRLL